MGYEVKALKLQGKW